MARLSNEFFMAWSSLSGDNPEPRWRAIAVPAAGPCELRAGRRSPDRYPRRFEHVETPII
jgi:hypothetical protein